MGKPDPSKTLFYRDPSKPVDEHLLQLREEYFFVRNQWKWLKLHEDLVILKCPICGTVRGHPKACDEASRFAEAERNRGIRSRVRGPTILPGEGTAPRTLADEPVDDSLPCEAGLEQAAESFLAWSAGQGLAAAAARMEAQETDNLNDKERQRRRSEMRMAVSRKVQEALDNRWMKLRARLPDMDGLTRKVDEKFKLDNCRVFLSSAATVGRLELHRSEHSAMHTDPHDHVTSAIDTWLGAYASWLLVDPGMFFPNFFDSAALKCPNCDKAAPGKIVRQGFSKETRMMYTSGSDKVFVKVVSYRHMGCEKVNGHFSKFTALHPGFLRQLHPAIRPYYDIDVRMHRLVKPEVGVLARTLEMHGTPISAVAAALDRVSRTATATADLAHFAAMTTIEQQSHGLANTFERIPVRRARRRQMVPLAPQVRGTMIGRELSKLLSRKPVETMSEKKLFEYLIGTQFCVGAEFSALFRVRKSGEVDPPGCALLASGGENARREAKALVNWGKWASIFNDRSTLLKLAETEEHSTRIEPTRRQEQGHAFTSTAPLSIGDQRQQHRSEQSNQGAARMVRLKDLIRPETALSVAGPLIDTTDIFPKDTRFLQDYFVSYFTDPRGQRFTFGSISAQVGSRIVAASALCKALGGDHATNALWLPPPSIVSPGASGVDEGGDDATNAPTVLATVPVPSLAVETTSTMSTRAVEGDAQHKRQRVL